MFKAEIRPHRYRRMALLPFRQLFAGNVLRLDCHGIGAAARSLLARWLTATPAENLTVRKHITAIVAQRTSFPFAGAFPAPIFPYQLLVTSTIGMIMGRFCTLALSACAGPRLS